MHIILTSIYFITVFSVCLHIIINTKTPSKGLAYLLLVLFFPLFGMLFYFSVGLNYRKRKLYQKKIDIDENAFPELETKRIAHSNKVLEEKRELLDNFFPLAQSISQKSLSSDNNKVSLFVNGEEKFPEVIKCLKAAKNHIHIEYYIYDNDDIGNQIAEILIEKAKEGLEIRFIYDDFGGKNIRNNIAKKLRKNGVEAIPFYKINFIHLANRLNYRNHRKIIVIDGNIGFVGGINVADNYINSGKNDLYWRDTHLKIEGSSVMNLQFTFLTDWNFCAKQNIGFSEKYFPISELETKHGDQLAQIVASGPDSDYPSILYSLIQIILLAKKELLITTPYFIPNSSFLDALKIAALSGVDVKLLIPGISDSIVTNTSSQSFYAELLEAGVTIYKYNKGFVHAKTMVCDDLISVVGTANLDNRSFDLNFEINAVVYDKNLAHQLKDAFHKDVEDSSELIASEWEKRSKFVKLAEKVLHLFSSLM